MSDVQLLTTELKAALSEAPVSRRIAMMRQVTVLFLESAPAYSHQHLALFDIVFATLSHNVERKILMELSAQLASANNAPPGIISRLASDDDIRIAGPILEKSSALVDDDAAEIAKTKSAAHMVAIANRPSISEVVTDALIGRGVPELSRMIVAHQDAKISHVGFVRLVSAANNDRHLAEMIASRSDLPDELQPFIKMTLERP